MTSGVLPRPDGPEPLLELAGSERDPGPASAYQPTSRDVLEALQVAAYTTDAAGRITFFNEAAASLWGRRPELGEEWCGSLHLYWPDGRPMGHAECPMAQTLHEQRPVSGTAIAERPDGTRVHFMAYPSPLFDDQGRLAGAINVLVDITAHQAAEQTIRASAEALRQSNAVKDEFLGLVSHELRTPVTTIYGNAQLLRSRGERLSSENRTEMVADIAQDAERLLAVIENLLLLTKIEGGVPPDLEPQVLAHVIRSTIEGFSTRRGRIITFTSVPAHHLVVDADRTYLDLLLGNLLSNADKYSRGDHPIEVVLRVAEGEVRVSVLDRGIGLPADVSSDDLFTPFYRAPAAREQASGMGIGLAVCKRLAEAQGGRVWAIPRDGGGAEVGFALPLAPEPEG
ncbi:MAG TPA: ATP-binding protein [Candidatus Limnocylindrales bacterium]|nr:ATP-binding protein [Candidatus Limnocylindrales bacterium]